MIVKCIANTGEYLRQFEPEKLSKKVFGVFGSSSYTQYGLTLGKEYIVMGMIFFDGHLAYLIDDGGCISADSCPLFEIVDSSVGSNWHFRLQNPTDRNYPYIQVPWGYHEFCYGENSYEDLIVERDEAAMQIYFRRKIGYEKELADEKELQELGL